MYIPVLWQDRIVEHPRRVAVTDLGNGVKEWAPDPGEVIQRGTQQSSTNFGNMDFGLVENALIVGLLGTNLRYVQDTVDNLRGQILNVALTNTLKYPASNAEKTIALPQMVNNTDYEVTAEVVTADGPVERVEVYGKALNAFKVNYYGSAKNVTVKLHVIGGLY
ncbi:hypothetical protein [Anaerocolumna xylanovorans]|uniref:Uncharacterized protein n=1 Tax=Anaerocolumna xylanovorans DSM 12503 TaxID=1121345 RepID=A0A1M7YC17_9FIRM|nr:hypothetical protein [Anaerocolumna xylanovorans]SHO50058.1 hypothetical protein SAMN02745217_02558 [Anaerocolumna xylanovorans DSM 12503]